MRKLMMLVAVCLSLAGVASATLISYSLTVNNGGLNYQAGTGGNFQLSKFDPSLGTLQSVLLEVTGYSIGGVNKIDNESSTDAGSATLSIGSSVTVVSGADAMTVVVLPSETLSGTVTTDTDVAPDFAGTDFLGVSGTTSQDSDSASPGNVNPYIGPGNVAFNFTSTGNMGLNFGAPLDFLDLLGPNGNGIDTVNPRYYIDAKITYTYQANDQDVPEPGTVLLLGASLLGLCGGAFRRLRRKV